MVYVFTLNTFDLNKKMEILKVEGSGLLEYKEDDIIKILVLFEDMINNKSYYNQQPETLDLFYKLWNYLHYKPDLSDVEFDYSSYEKVTALHDLFSLSASTILSFNKLNELLTAIDNLI